jgi:predicted regulator of Ras-like GTPase activity (Roadblock/LC7/MglB family)
MTEEAQTVAVAQADEIVQLGEARAAEMGSQPFTQLVVEGPSGYVFFARELAADGMSMLATGKKGSRVGLVLYDLRTCMRDARDAMGTAQGQEGTGEA